MTDNDLLWWIAVSTAILAGNKVGEMLADLTIMLVRLVGLARVYWQYKRLSK